MVEQTPAPRRRRWWVWILLVVIIAVVAFALLRKTTAPPPAGRHGGGAAAANQPQPVTEAAVKTGDMPVVVKQIATVTPLATVTVQSQISGYITQINFTEGQEVKKGDVLIVVDPRQYQATVDQDQGALERDQALLKQAQVDLARYQLLGRQKSIQQQTIDDELYTVKQYEGTVKNDLGALEAAKVNLSYCYIRAPVDGRVGLRQIDLGNYVTSGETNGLVVETQLKPMSVVFAIPQQDIPQLMERVAAKATLPVEAWDAADATAISTNGAVSNVDTQVDTTTGTVKLRALFPNDDEKLFPSAFVNAHLLLNTLHNVLLVPDAAVQTGPNGLFVYVIGADNTVSIRNVTTGVSGSGNTVIKTGLKEGENVVTDGTDHLRSGSKVTIPAAPKMADPNAQPAHHGGHRHHTQDGETQTPANGEQGPQQNGQPAQGQQGGGSQPAPAPAN